MRWLTLELQNQRTNFKAWQWTSGSCQTKFKVYTLLPVYDYAQLVHRLLNPWYPFLECVLYCAHWRTVPTDYFNIKHILDTCCHCDTVEYLVKWSDYPPNFHSWEINLVKITNDPSSLSILLCHVLIALYNLSSPNPQSMADTCGPLYY